MIRVYLHVPLMGHYREVVAELVGMIDASGIYDHANTLLLMTTGHAEAGGLIGQRWTVQDSGLGIESYEYPTLQQLHADAINRPEASYLYLHCKGVSHSGPKRATRDAWRRYMAYHVIGRWEECLELLKDYDTVGTEIRLPPKHAPKHYAGNFWWARGEYLARLPVPLPHHPEPRRKWPSVRHGAETWLLDTIEDVRAYSFHAFEFPFWKRTIEESRYRGASVPA